MLFRELLEKPVENVSTVLETLYAKSIEVAKESQMPTGGTMASLKGSRYAGHTYPRDHAYAIRAFISADMAAEAKKALLYILNVELSEDGVMYQRYDESQKSTSNKPPQIDGNAQTLVALGEYVRLLKDKELAERYKERVLELLRGLEHNTHTYPHGDLVFSVNGIIEFAPFEEGFEIYTNAVVYRAYKEAATLFGEVYGDTKMRETLHEKADRIKRGIEHYLYIPAYGGFMACVRMEPNPSVVTIANLKSFLALVDFDVFDATDEKIVTSLQYHLEGTKNDEIGGYNRYGAAIGRHNFGNGPWPMVMMRLCDYYVKANKQEEAQKCLTWVLNVALQNKDVEMALPEHVVTKEEIVREYEGFMRVYDISKREERKKEYEKNMDSEMMKQFEVAYPINPLVWSHTQFILVWNRVKGEMGL